MSESTENVETELTPLEIAIAVLEPVIDEGGDEEAMSIALIKSGVKASRLGAMLKLVLEAKGLAKSAKDRFAEASELLVNWDFKGNVSEWKDVEEAAVSISEEVDETTKIQALAAIRKFAKANEIELPKKPKGAGGSRTSIDDLFFDWAVNNQDAGEAEINNFLATQNITEKQLPKYVSAYMARITFARKFAEMS
jgi:transcriptional regulator with AAA-type ATPase domain